MPGIRITGVDHTAQLLARALAVAICLLAGAGLLGWLFHLQALKTLVTADHVPMVANSAACFLASGVCLYLLTGLPARTEQWAIRTLSVFIFFTGVLTILEYISGLSFGIDELLASQPDPISNKPGRMSILSAVNFAIVGICCWVETRAWSQRREALDFAMLACLFTTLYPFTGTLFGAVHVSSQNTNMAISSAVGFFLFTAGYFLRRPDRGLTALLFTPNIAGVLLRRILFPLVVLYPLVVFLTIQGEKAGLYNTEGGMVFMLVTSLALFTTIVLVTARTINQLDDEKDQYKRFFELSSEVLMIARTDGTIRLVSAAFTRGLGYSSQEGMANSFFYFVHPDDVDEVAQRFDRMKNALKPESLQVRMTDKNGKLRFFLWSFTRDSRAGDVYAAGYDITEIKEAQQVRELANQLQRQNEQLANFAHIASHNLRSHVGNLSSLLKLHKEADTSEQAVLLEMVDKVTKHLSDTLSDLIESIRIKEDTAKERQVVHFTDVLTKTKDVLASQLLEAKAIVVDSFPVPSIHYPPVYLESIFLNLISNAVKYRSPDRDPVIRVKTAMEDGEPVLTIADNGLGIDLERHGDKLFGLYKTFHTTKDAKGLGLFITKVQVEAMGGRITVESAVDRGTSFHIHFGSASA